MKTNYFLYLFGLLGFIVSTSFVNSQSIDDDSNNRKPLVSQNKDDAKLKVSLVPTYGPNGAERPTEVFPGDTFYVKARLSGIATQSDGKPNGFIVAALYRPAPNTVPVFQLPRYDINDKIILGGDSTTQFLHFYLPRDIDPGKYFIRVYVSDEISGENTIKELPFDVLPRTAFGVINLAYCHDSNHLIPACVTITVGEVIYLNANFVGFDTATGETHVTCKLTILDTNKTVVFEAEEFDVRRPAPAVESAIPVNYILKIDRAGKFMVKLEATDQIAKKSVEYRMPLIAVESPRINEIKLDD